MKRPPALATIPRSPAEAPSRTPPRRPLATLIPRDRRARAGLVLLGSIVLLALVGPLFTLDPTAPVAAPLSPPSWAHLLGTTGQGQDVLAQTLAGARVTLAVGFTAGLLSVLIGATVGSLAGYLGGWVDDLLSLATNVTLVLPGLPLAVLLAAWLPPGPISLVAVLVCTGWAWNARVLRAEVLQLRRRDWVDAARLAGESPLRIVLVELLPNLRPLLAASLVGATLYNLGAQVGLEFLGLGDPGAVTWGTNLYWAANDGALLTRSWWTFVPTGVGVAAVGLALALLNAGLAGAAGGGAATSGAAIDTPVVRRRPWYSARGDERSQEIA
ncbi:MAG: ABC transporter permease [Pseudomonadota bacterium]|nr:ABC transporter permease [Pseudomonadota bacterium]